jgi:biotin carboxyl carrier protein
MKMETTLVAPVAGKVAMVNGRAGTQVAAGVCIVVIEPVEADPA